MRARTCEEERQQSVGPEKLSGQAIQRTQVSTTLHRPVRRRRLAYMIRAVVNVFIAGGEATIHDGYSLQIYLITITAFLHHRFIAGVSQYSPSKQRYFFLLDLV